MLQIRVKNLRRTRPKYGVIRPSQACTTLVVDDNEAILGLVTVILRRIGFTVLGAGTIDDAMAVVQNNGRPIDLAIIDMTLPAQSSVPGIGTSGLDLAAALERHQVGVKILYITGNSCAMAMQAILHQSPGQVLFKPFTEQDVVERVLSLLAPHSISSGRPAAPSPDTVPAWTTRSQRRPPASRSN